MESQTRGHDWQGIAIPIALMITGIALLGGDLLGFLSLDRIQNFWPAAVIAIGVMELLSWHSEDRKPPADSVTARSGTTHDVPQIR
jgi:hypothetical protein